MSIVYNTIGSISALKKHLAKAGIDDFSSLNDIIEYQNAYAVTRQRLLAHHQALVAQEAKLLHETLQSLDATLQSKRRNTEELLMHPIEALKQQREVCFRQHPSGIFNQMSRYLRLGYYNILIKYKLYFFDWNVKRAIRQLSNDYRLKSDRYQFITSNEAKAVHQSAQHSLAELDRKKAVLDQLSNLIYGALGEHKIVKALENLPDEYILINDFSVSFSQAIYNGRTKDYIKSVQIDHILVAPSGIFLIETKNWSKESMDNLNLWSPVEQIRRANFVLYKLLSDAIQKQRILLDKHHWGDRKISIKNILVLVNHKPREEFQYVKVLTLSELCGYVQYFKPIFSLDETQRIADFLLHLQK